MNTRALFFGLAALVAVNAPALGPTPAAAHFDGGWGNRYGGGERQSGWLLASGDGERPPYQRNDGYQGNEGYLPRYGPRHYGYGPIYGHDPNSFGVPAALPPVANPGCLSKSYLPDGAVLFADTCTNETAISRPERPPPSRRGDRIER